VTRAKTPEPAGEVSSSKEDEVVVVGSAIRALRRERCLSLRELSRKSGLSTGFRSMVERGKSSLALTSLNNAAKALDVELVALFPPGRKVRKVHPLPHVTRAEEDGQVSIASNQRVYKVLSPRASGLILEPLFVTVQPGSDLEEPYAHDGEEFAYVLDGEIMYIVEGVEYRLGPGDSIHVLSTVPHAIHNNSGKPVRILWVLTPRFV
jgi:quercetin dioxygenase-like cupin family protein